MNKTEGSDRSIKMFYFSGREHWCVTYRAGVLCCEMCPQHDYNALAKYVMWHQQRERNRRM